MIIVFLYAIFFSSFNHAADNRFSNQQREEAQAFINESFDLLDQKLSEQVAEVLQDFYVIDAKDFSSQAERYISMQTILSEAQKKKESLIEPKHEILNWTNKHEEHAQALKSLMVLTDLWETFQADPTDMKAYQRLHQFMQTMAASFTDDVHLSERAFIAGSSSGNDKKAEHKVRDIDRVFFLTLYLLDQELKA